MENVFKQDAKSIVDMLFDGNLFNDKITRDDMNTLEEFIKYCMESRFESYLKMKELAKRMEV